MTTWNQTEYLSCSEHHEPKIRFQEEEVKRVKTFKYLGSTLADDGELDTEVNVHSGWMN